MSAWLITGGAGFIGSNFVRMAAARTEARLVILDALTYAGNLANISDLLRPPRVEFVKGDICDGPLVMRLFETHSVTHVIHFAAESHVDRSILGARPFIRTNIEGTFTLLEAARNSWKNPDGMRFLHVSTDEVYGSLGPKDPPFNENTPYRPNSPYSASKAAADHLVRAWHHTYGLPTIISNCSNNYGPWQFPEKLIPLMILNALEGKELPVYGDGLQVRDWLHVADHCEALLQILERGRVGETYTVGGNNGRANLDVVHAICDTVDDVKERPSGNSRKLIRHVKDRPGHDRRYSIDSSKLRNETGWMPRHVFEKALADVVAWYIEHTGWADSVRSGEYLKFYQQLYRQRGTT
ncbi:MAG TPA: dTDP-glucose 4,6-dehydratase [Nitrospiria bacterium]